MTTLKKSALTNAPLSIKPATEEQSIQRKKFKALQGLLKVLKPVLKKGFKNLTADMTPTSKAFTVNFPKIFSDAHSDLKINYAELQLSDGYAPKLRNLVMEDKGNGFYGLSWDKCDCLLGKYNRVALVLYEEAQHEVFYEFNFSHVKKQEAEFGLSALNGSRVHVYLFTVGLLSVNRSSNSTSQYLGMIV